MLQQEDAERLAAVSANFHYVEREFGSLVLQIFEKRKRLIVGAFFAHETLLPGAT